MAQEQRTTRLRPFLTVRNQLLLATIIMALLPLTIFTIAELISLRGDTLQTLDSNLEKLAVIEANELGLVLTNEIDLLSILAEDDALKQELLARNASYAGTEAEIEAELTALQEQWRAAGDIETALVRETLASGTSEILNRFSERFPDHPEIFVVDARSRVIGTSNRVSNLVQAPRFTNSATSDYYNLAWQGGQATVYMAPEIVFDESVGGDTLRIVVPVYDEGQALGLIVTNWLATGLTAPLEQVSSTEGDFIVGETSVIARADGSIVAQPSALNLEQLDSTILIADDQLLNFTAATEPFFTRIELITTDGAQPVVDGLGWYAVVLQLENIALATFNSFLQRAIIIAGVIILLGAALAYWLTQRFTRPLSELQSAAEQIGQQRQWSTRVSMDRRDEFGVLGNAFDTMAGELETIVRELENRVNARTADLETSADIAAAANAVREVEELTTLAVNLIRDRFDFYYTQIYFVDPSGQFAVLADGTGYVGRRLLAQGHRLALDEQSLVANSINSERLVFVDDTRTDPNFLPNELLPETRSELVIPLRLSGDVIGVLDIQHNEPNTFDADARRLFQTLADQLAVTIENARLLRRAEERAREMATVAEVSIQSTASLDMQQLLRTVTKLTRDNFQLYHAQIFLLDEDAVTLKMAAGAGEAGLLMLEQGHQITVDEEQSIVAQAARTASVVLANDVASEPNFKPNALLPQTRSELAVPLIVGQNLLGVLDVQSDKVNDFDDDDVQVLTTLSAQVAVAVQNARIFTETENAQLLLETVINGTRDWIFAKDSNFRYIFVNDFYAQAMGKVAEEMIGKDDIENGFPPEQVLGDPELGTEGFRESDREVLRTNKMVHLPLEFVTTALGEDVVLETNKMPLRDNEGRVIGVLGFARIVTERYQNEQLRQLELEVVNRFNIAQTAAGVIQALESYAKQANVMTIWLMYLALDEEGQPFRAEVMETWGDTVVQPGISFALPEYEVVNLWIQDQFAPLLHESVETDKRLDDVTRQVYQSMGVRSAAILPMNLQDQWLGLWMVGWADEHQFTERDRRIFNTIIFQSTPVIGSIRNVEQIGRRVAELTTVAEVGTAATAMLDVEGLLKRVSDLTVDRFGHYHAHIYLYDDEKELMRLAAGAGFAGDEMVQNNHSISYNSEHSIVARAANTREVVISNDVMWDGIYLPNPLLPETRSELALPMLAAGELIGVLDVQSVEANRFTQEDAVVLGTLANQVAVSVANARLFEETERRIFEMEAMAQISTETAAKLDVEDLLWSVADLTQRDFRRYHVNIYMLDADINKLVVRAASGQIGREIVKQGYTLGMGVDAIVTRAARERKPVVVNNTQLSPDYLPSPYLPDVAAVLAIPILYGDELLGVLEISDDESNVFGSAEVQTKQTLANQVAVAIKNAQQYQLTQQRLREVVANARVGEVLSSDLGLVETLETIFRIVLDTLEPDNIVMTNYNARTQRWVGYIGIGSGMSNAIARTINEPFDYSPHGLKAFQERKVIPVDNARTYPNFPEQYIESIGIKSVLTIPVVVDGEGRAVVYLNYNTALRSFTEDDIRLAGVIANQLALAIERREAEEEQILLLTATQGLNDARTVQDVLDVFRTYVETIGAFSANLFHLDPAADGSLEWATSVAGWLDGSNEWLVPAGTQFYLPELPFSQLWLRDPHNPTFIEDMQHDERVDENTRAIYADLNIRGAVLVPLNYQARWIGVVTINWADPFVASARDKRIVRQIMRQATPQVDAIRTSDVNAIARLEADTLYQISARINEAEAETELLAAVVQNSLIDQATSTALGLFDNDDPEQARFLHIVADWNEERQSLQGLSLPLEQMSYLIELGSDDVSLVDNLQEDERLSDNSRAILEALGVGAVITVPLTLARRWLGVLSFYADEPTTFTERQRRVMRSLGRQLTAAIERLNLLRRAEERAAELETVAQLSAATTTILDSDELLQSVVELTKTSFDLYHAHVYLLDEVGDRLVLAAGAGESGRLMKERGHGISLNHPDSIVARCARERTGIIANDVHETTGFLPNPLLPDTRSELAVPMIVGGALIGVLDTQSSQINHFTENDVRLKTTLADQIAVAVQNAQAFERERRAADYYREADRLKQEFLANMSHELRTPLNSIIGYSEVLLDGVDGDLTEDAVEDVEAIYNSGRHLLNIINEILDLAKIEAGQMQLHIKPMSLKDALQHVVKSSQILVKEKPVELQLIAETDIPEILGDQVRINQIMLNLVSNAIKFTEVGTIVVRYGLQDEETICISVEDSGVGMTPENLEVIFDRFRQVDGSSTRRAGGTGLGLTITKQLVQMHGGDIGVQTEENVGSTFWFTVPTLEAAEARKKAGTLDRRRIVKEEAIEDDMSMTEAGD